MSSAFPKLNAVLICLVFAVMNYPLLPPNIRYSLMGAIALYLVGFTVLKLLSQGISDYKAILSFAVLFVFYLFFHHLFFPPDSEYGSNKYVYLNFLFLLGFVVVPVALGDVRGLKVLGFGLFVVSIGFCFISVLGQVSTENIRTSQLGLNPSIMGKICIIPAIYVGSQLLTAGSKVKWWHIIIILLSVAAIVKTGSRSVLVLYLFSMILMSAYVSVSKSFLRISLSIFVALGAFMIALQLEFIPIQIAERFQLENWLPSAHRDEGDRLDIYGLALELIFENPAGVGLGNFASFHRFIVAPHNFILESSVELGWIAGILFMCLFGWIFIAYKRVSRHADGGMQFIFMLYCNAILNSMVGGEMTHQSFLLYLSAGILVVSLKRDSFPKTRATLKRRNSMRTRRGR